MQRRQVLILALLLSGCRFCAQKPAPPTWGAAPADDARPASLGPNGIVVEQPKPGETLQGKWVAVTGWIDPSKYAAVLVSGGQNGKFMLPQPGHGAVPTVPVLVRADGRFIAPRVPLDEGATAIEVVPLPVGSSPRPPEGAAIELQVTGQSIGQVPATIVVQPASGLAPLTATLQAASASGAADVAWQWDFNGDGKFDATSKGSAPGTHVYDHPGHFSAIARTFDGTRWIYAAADVTVAAPPDLLADAAADHPRAIAVDEDYRAWAGDPNFNYAWPDGGCCDFHKKPPPLPTGDTALIRKVVLADGDQLRIFDAALNPVATLSGFSAPAGVAVDESGRIYVTDTGHARVVRLLPDGGPDASFGTLGAYAGPSDAPFQSPTSLLANDKYMRVLDSARDAIVSCSFGGDGGFECATSKFRLVDDDDEPITSPPVQHIGAMGSVFTHLGPSVDGCQLADGTRLLAAGSGSFLNPDLTIEGEIHASLLAMTATDMIRLETVYTAGADSEGAIDEWAAGKQIRREKLEFPVTALAVDPWGSLVRQEAYFSNSNTAEGTGPIVLYVAGHGHIQRRLMQTLEVSVW